MTTEQQTFVIVGAGLAGAKAAEALRTDGFDGQVVLLGEEAERPYNRPPLSKDYLQGKSEKDKIYVHPEALVRRARHRPAAGHPGHRPRPRCPPREHQRR